jgi:hypothetical protein
LESLSLSAATINLHLSAIRRLADEAAAGLATEYDHIPGMELEK